MIAFLVDFGTVVAAMKWWLIAGLIVTLVWLLVETRYELRRIQRQNDKLLAENARRRERGRTRIEIPVRARRPIQRGPVVRR